MDSLATGNNLFVGICSKLTNSNKEAFLPIFSSNSEAFASELLEILLEMFPWYYIHSNVFSVLNDSTTH